MRLKATLGAVVVALSKSLLADDGPIAYWRADGDAHDSMGSRHGVLVGDVAFVAGIAPWTSGQAFDFNGSDSEIRVPDSISFDFSQGVTVTGWMQTASSADFSGMVDNFAQAAQITGFQVGLSGSSVFFPNQPGILRADLGIGSTYVVAYNLIKVNDGQPHHFALTCDHQQAILYVDGVPGAPVATNGWIPDNSEELVIGRDNVLPDRFFLGQLDEVTLYGRALTAREIQALAGQPVLDIATTAPGFVTLSWPANAFGFRLQSNDSLDQSGWTDTPSGTSSPLTLPLAPPTRFFRLVKP